MKTVLWKLALYISKKKYSLFDLAVMGLVALLAIDGHAILAIGTLVAGASFSTWLDTITGN